MMHMTFYWGTQATILFDWWRTKSVLSYTITLLFCFLFATFFQYMEDRRLTFLALATSKPLPTTTNTTTPLLGPAQGTNRAAPWTNPARFATSILFMVNAGIGYLLMLAVMSFNGGVFVAVVLGLGVGYFAFRCKEYELVIKEEACACS